jgi:FR47-like protein
VRIPVGGLNLVVTLAEARGRGYARTVVASATAFVGIWLSAPFALVLCTADATSFYGHLGWRKIDERISYNGPGGQLVLTHRVAMVVACQGEADWPSAPIDLCGAPW